MGIQYGPYTSNSIEGDSFILSIASKDKEDLHQRELFFEFIRTKGISAWHIHDGWVRLDYKSGDILDKSKDLKIGWIHEHAGYSHSPVIPQVGEKICIIKDSPCKDRHKNKFILYCYEVISWSLPINIYYLNIRLVEKIPCIYDAGFGYKYYQKPKKKSFIRKIFEFIKVKY